MDNYKQLEKTLNHIIKNERFTLYFLRKFQNRLHSFS
ncbi:Uncharacterised protein [Catenibacterium mitsuokai]|nr:Uncharacterised protein [Catenibacterium mitsuokai]